MRPLPDIGRIAVLRANGIGDLTFALPALEALRGAYPAARITLLGRRWHQEFLRSRPGPVDEVEVVPAYAGVRTEPLASTAEEQEQFFVRMQARSFDLALQMHGGGRNSNPFVARLGARVSAGLRTADARALDRNVPYEYYQPEILRLLEVAAAVGAQPLALEPSLSVTEADRAEAAAVLGDRSAQSRRLVALNPGAGDPRRRWPPESFAAVGDRLAVEGADVVVVGSAADAALAASVAGAMENRVADLAARLSLGGLLGLFERCRVVVSNDSGPLHLAAAVGAATVGIYWCGNLINAGPLFRTRHRPRISWRLECPTCGVDCTRGSCPHDESFVAEVPVTEVAAAALELYAASTAGR